MTLSRLLAAALFAAAAMATAADAPEPEAFAWRATLDTGGHQGLVRLPVPADVLARLQTRSAADLRVFDAQDRPVAFAFATPPRPADAPRAQTAAVPALPLHAAPAGTALPKGTLQMHVERDGTKQSVWVRLSDRAADVLPPAATTRLPSALFDTRALREPVSGFAVRARLPANVPVRVTLSTSKDLASWTPVPVQGRLYRFDGAGAPVNDQLELTAPLNLKDRYLRLDWSGYEGVAVDAIAGLLSAGAPPRDLPGVDLPPPVVDGPGAVEWQLGFATPIAKLQLATPRANTLLPVRVLGRNDASQRWRLLANAVVYRLGPPEQESLNPAIVLPHPGVRWLRVEATHGMRLEGVTLAARALFEPMEIVFAAGGDGPYRLAAGHEGMQPSALPLGMLAATTTTPVEALPLARIAEVQSGPATASPLQAWLPRGVDGKTATLWLVLVLGVLVLGAVAWSLLRQVNGKPRE